MGLELSGHQCVGFCEWDKFAAASYTSMHLIKKEQRKSLEKLSVKQRQKEILKEEYRNGEWYSNDIRTVHAGDIPESECWTFGAPCQDFSLAGKRDGLNGDRSSLVREVFRIMEEMQEKDRPEWIIYENVKGMLSSNRGIDYLSIISEMDRLGYDIQWQNINSKWWVPQNRERIYTVGHIRKRGSAKIFPITGTDGENYIQKVERLFNKSIKIIGRINSSQDGLIHSIDGISQCQSAGNGNCAKVAISVLTPEREKKRQNGRRFKENEEPMFTLTAQDRHGVAIDVFGFNTMPDGTIRTLKHKYQKNSSANFNMKTSRGASAACVRIKENSTFSFKNSNKKNDGIYVEMPGGFLAYCVWYEKYQCYIAIRKLTPKECFRLQGWSDDYFEKAAFVNSDSQLYKQAGNGVTVDVVREIGRKIKMFEEKRKMVSE